MPSGKPEWLTDHFSHIHQHSAAHGGTTGATRPLLFSSVPPMSGRRHYDKGPESSMKQA